MHCIIVKKKHFIDYFYNLIAHSMSICIYVYVQFTMNCQYVLHVGFTVSYRKEGQIIIE